MERSYIVCCVAILALCGSAIVDSAATSPFIKKFMVNQNRTGSDFHQFDSNKDGVVTKSEIVTALNRRLNNENEMFVPALTVESLCFLEYYSESTCPSDGFYTCILELPKTSYYLSVRDHIQYLQSEIVSCSESSQQDKCVHREILACTKKFNFFDAYEQFTTCDEVPKAKKCLQNIRNKCTSASFRTDGMYSLVWDRVKIAETECRAGYYDEGVCNQPRILKCFEQFINDDMQCDTSYLGTSYRCLQAMGRTCMTGPAQALVKVMTKALGKQCMY